MQITDRRSSKKLVDNLFLRLLFTPGHRKCFFSILTVYCKWNYHWLFCTVGWNFLPNCYYFSAAISTFPLATDITDSSVSIISCLFCSLLVPKDPLSIYIHIFSAILVIICILLLFNYRTEAECRNSRVYYSFSP